ncbi:MAG: tRNA (adenosine(37)-N6)-dimethylallyltransferase MiaA [Chloroflexota bacterium]
MRVAGAIGGEIVSADSRQVYRGMDIGTAKPTTEERARVPHHLIDVADPGERYDVFRFQADARAVLDAIGSRGRAAVVVGGTGLYVRALLDGLDLASVPTDPVLRARIEAEAERDGADALHRRLQELDPRAAARVDARNIRRVVRYVEAALLTGGLTASWRRDGAIPARRIGLAPPRATLISAIEARVRRMVDAGVLEETRALLARVQDPTSPSLTGHGYVHWSAHLRGEITLDEAAELTIRDTRRYSRRQMTWFRRDSAVRWMDPTAEDPLPATLSE